MALTYIDAFKKDTELLKKYSEDKAHLVWAIALHIDCPDTIELASECLTDGPEDKKADFIQLNLDNK